MTPITKSRSIARIARRRRLGRAGECLGRGQRLHGGTIRFPPIVTDSAGVANAFAGFALLSTEKFGVVNRIDTMH